YEKKSFKSSHVDKSGRFTFRNLQDGTYQIDIGSLPGDTYVVDILQGGKSISARDFKVDHGSTEPLEVIANPSGGSIVGSVPNGSPAEIMLVPMDGQRRFALDPGFTTRIGVESKSGDFIIRGVAPGKYLIFAFKLPADGGWNAISDSDLTGRYAKQGTPLTVK